MVNGAVTSNSTQSRPATAASNLVAQLKTSPRKTALLCGLSVVLVVILIRAATRPESASAKAVELLPPKKPTLIFQSTPLGVPVFEPSSEVSADIGSTVETEDTSDALPSRDIFAIDLSYFEQLSSDQIQAAGTAAPKQMKLTARATVRQFRLQSTMTGPVPAVYIDGILLREGQIYEGFQIKQINNRSVLLEKDGHVFNLRMAQ